MPPPPTPGRKVVRKRGWGILHRPRWVMGRATPSGTGAWGGLGGGGGTRRTRPNHTAEWCSTVSQCTNSSWVSRPSRVFAVTYTTSPWTCHVFVCRPPHHQLTTRFASEWHEPAAHRHQSPHEGGVHRSEAGRSGRMAEAMKAESPYHTLRVEETQRAMLPHGSGTYMF